MLEKKNVWLSFGLFASCIALPVIVGIILLFTQYNLTGQFITFNWLSILFGFLYYLGYIHYDEFSKPSKIFRIIGRIVGILCTVWCFIGLSAVDDGGAIVPLVLYDGVGVCLLYGFSVAPLLWWLFSRKLLEKMGEEEWPQTKISITFAIYAAVCYVLGAVSVMFGALWCVIGTYAIVTIVEFYLKGGLTDIQKLIFNVIYHVALVTVGIILVTSVFPIPTLHDLLGVGTIFGWIAVAAAFLWFLGWDYTAERRAKYPYANSKLIYIGVIAAVVIGGLGLGFTIAEGHALVGMKDLLRSDFKNSFLNAVYFTPFTFLLLRYPLYTVGFKRKWSSIVELTIALTFPIACYILTVIFLLIGFIYVVAAVLAIIGILLLIAKIKHIKMFEGDDSIVGFETSIGGYNAPDCSPRESCPGLGDDLKSISIHKIQGLGWCIKNPWDFKVSYNDNAKKITVTVKVMRYNGAYVQDHEVRAKIDDLLENVVDNYQTANPKTRAVKFDVIYNISFSDE